MQAVFYVVSRPPNIYYANNVNRDTVLLKKGKEKNLYTSNPHGKTKQQTNKQKPFFSVFSSQFVEFKDTVPEDTQSQVH